MNLTQFEQTVQGDPYLTEAIYKAAEAGNAKQFGMVSEVAMVAIMFPIVGYVLKHIGLPWLYELKRYSELQRQKVHSWIDQTYRDNGIDPDAAELASDTLLRELESTVNPDARAAWERLAKFIKKSSDEEPED